MPGEGAPQCQWAREFEAVRLRLTSLLECASLNRQDVSRPIAFDERRWRGLNLASSVDTPHSAQEQVVFSVGRAQ